MTSPAIPPTPPPSAVWLRPIGPLSITNSAISTLGLIQLTAVRPPLRFLLSPEASSTPQLLQLSLVIYSSPAIPLPPTPPPLISLPLLHTTNFFGAGLTTCQSNNVLTYDGAGKFGCEADDSGSGSGSDPFTHPSFGFSATTSQMLFGTSTASNYQLTVSSSTAPQLSLSSGAGFGQWTFRNAGGNLYFATTTVAGTATTSTSALTIIGSSGNVGIASSTNNS